jgi:hypothetical protein
MKPIKFIQLLFFFALVSVLLSCNRDEIFEREQYKVVTALLSDDGFNIFSEELKFSDEAVDGYIAASCGGVLPTTEAININIVEDAALLRSYNLSNFDTDATRYSLYLSGDRYEIDKKSITIPAGERTGRMHIRLRTAGLSPDSVYMIPLRVSDFSAYEFNPKKNTILYRLYLKNKYASTKDGEGSTIYSHRGKKGATNTMMNKEVFPVGSNQIRFMAGNKPFEKKEALIQKWSVRVTVNDDNSLTVEPWSTLFGTSITQVDGDEEYPNVFQIVDNGYNTYKTFLLRYDYVDPDDGNTYEMKEELRLAFNEREEEE